MMFGDDDDDFIRREDERRMARLKTLDTKFSALLHSLGGLTGEDSVRALHELATLGAAMVKVKKRDFS